MDSDDLRRLAARVHTAMTGQKVWTDMLGPREGVPACNVPDYPTDPAQIEPMMRWLDERVPYAVGLFLSIDEWFVGKGSGEEDLATLLANSEPTPNLALCAAVLSVAGKEGA